MSRWIKRATAGERLLRCNGKRCRRTVEFVCEYLRHDERLYARNFTTVRRPACRQHAERFARKFGLEMPK